VRVSILKIGDVVLSRITDAEDMRRFAKELNIRGKGFVIKPNWSNANTYTSAENLDFLFDCLEGKKTVVEGYTAWRNRLNTGPEPKDFITPKNAKRKWKWIKEQDSWFLKYSGIDKVLKVHGVDYINITEEVWNQRTAAKEKIQKIVEERFGPLKNEEMYEFVPNKIYTLRGHSLISLNLSRITREVMSLSTKNLFGLIPDPARYGKWHGENDSLLPQSIADINKLYRSLFEPCFWINETVDRKLLVGSENSVQADAVTASIIGADPKKIAYLQFASQVFGRYDANLLTRIEKALESL